METATLLFTAVCAITGIICAIPVVTTWWRDREKKLMSPAPGAWRSWAALVLSAFALTFSGAGLYRVARGHSQFPIHWNPEAADVNKLVLVYGQTYQNQEVLIDGRKYDHCTFDNVSFVYHGTTNWFFTAGNVFKGKILLKTDNDAIKAFNALAGYITAIPGISPPFAGTIDEHGNVVHQPFKPPIGPVAP